MKLDESQEKIANETDGLTVVDAGPGTGKTHTVIARCLNILRRKDIGPSDVMMLTFTRNAAAEMRERLSSEIDSMFAGKEIGAAEHTQLKTLANGMRIQTFDSYCLAVVKAAPSAVGKFFRCGERLTSNASITENDALNARFFGRILDRFLDENGASYPRTAPLMAADPEGVYRLICKLMARGTMPLSPARAEPDGIGRWFSADGDRDLVGDVEKASKLDPGSIESKDRERFRRMPSAAPGGSGFDIATLIPLAAADDRSELIRAVHDVYFEFIRRSCAEDRLTFGLASVFAFAVLYSDSETRERMRCRYLIVDEFQDTNGNQLMISMMSLKEPNLCAVGDWKQGIYGFRYVSIENIRKFGERLRKYRKFLDDGKHGRVAFDIGEVRTRPLLVSYRSSAAVIDAAFATLGLAASKEDRPDTDGITKIRPDWDDDESRKYSRVEYAVSGDSGKETVERIIGYTNGSTMVRVRQGKTRILRPASYRDIAVLCRTSSGCREVYRMCRERGIPAFLQGEMEIMSTEEGRILLAWLRYINDPEDRWGIGAVLTFDGYSARDITSMIGRLGEGETRSPEAAEAMAGYRDKRRMLLGKRRRITDLISAVFSFYGLNNDMTQALTTVISRSHEGSLMTISDVIGLIEDGIKNGTTYPVDGVQGEDAVTIQTMHKSKGLEYPIVIIPYVNRGTFPSTRGDDSMFTYSPLLGIRCGRCIEESNGSMLIEDSWKTFLMKKCQTKDYGEERRLFFVAVSRAMQYVTVIGSNSKFLEGMIGSGTATAARSVKEGSVPAPVRGPPVPAEMPAVPEMRQRRLIVPVHDILRTVAGTDVPASDGADGAKKSGGGMAYGTAVHKYIEMMADGLEVGQDVFEKYPETAAARKIIDGIKSRGMEIQAEIDCSLPLDSQGMRATLMGTMDLIAFDGQTVEVHDWKSDAGAGSAGEYRMQVSVYAHVAESVYPGHRVKCFIQWLAQGRTEEFDPLSMEAIAERAREMLR